MPTTRKLSAIVFVDIASYTAMMSKDERATLHLLEELRKFMYPLVESRGGAVLKELGDGALLSFDSALDAVNCSAELQREVKAVPNLKLRIGIHIGDVVVQEKDIHGSGVNVAARVQPLAAPGGVVVTEDVWKQVRNQPGLSFVSLGQRRLKGVAAPLRVYTLKGEDLAVPKVQQRITSHRAFKPSLAGLALITLGLLSYLFVPEVRQLTGREVPSLAILYLKNLGPESDEPYSYGITHDLIVDIAKAGLIRVTPMKDVLAYQKSDLSVEKIAEQLRVRYVMEGSLRRESVSFKLTAQIVEATTGKTLWADRIQTTTSGAAELQGRLAQAILQSLAVQPSSAMAKEITKSRTTNPKAYEFYLRAKYVFDKKKTKQDVEIARGLLEQALSLDTAFVGARIGLGQTYELQGEYERAQQIYEKALTVAQINEEKLEEAKCLWRLGVVRSDLADYRKALEYFERSLRAFKELEDRDDQARVLNSLGIVHVAQGDYERALAYFMKSLNIKRELGDRRGEGNTLLNIGVVYQTQGDFSKSLDYSFQSLKVWRELDEKHSAGITLGNVGVVYMAQGNYSKALEYYEENLKIDQEVGDRRSEGQTLHNIGNVHLAQGDYDKAFQYYSRSLEIIQAVSDLSTEGKNVQNMGRLSFLQKHYKRAIDSLARAVRIFKEIGEKHNLADALSWFAAAQMNIGNREKAEETLSKVEEIITLAQGAEDFVAILWRLSQVCAFLGDSLKSAQYLQKAHDEVMSRAGRISDKTIRDNFLLRVQTNRDIVEAWEKQQKTKQPLP